MITLWLCLTAVLTISPAYGDVTVQSFRVYPALNGTLAGVFQITKLDEQQEPQYAFNASEARDVCEEFDVVIASKAQVQEALDRGLETCRFGWVDEQIAVVPRINARRTCGQSGVGLVTWRADVTKKFDVFCFNSSAEDAHTNNVSMTVLTGVLSALVNVTVELMAPDAEVAARFAGSEESSSGGKAIIITSACGLLLIAIAVIVYLKLRRRRSDQTEKVETE